MRTQKNSPSTCLILRLLAFSLVIVLAACGNKGDLFLELDERTAEQVETAEKLIGSSSDELEQKEDEKRKQSDVAPDENGGQTDP